MSNQDSESAAVRVVGQSAPDGFTWPHMRWLNADTVLVTDRIDDARRQLAAEELADGRVMTARRWREFAAGRHTARQALAALGLPAVGIPIGCGGEPLWPTGLSGSLSHTATHATALVTKGTRYTAVGVDLDDQRPLGDLAAAGLMTEQELDLVIQLGWASHRAAAQNVVFSAKEALFKCQYPLTGNRNLDFDEVRLVSSSTAGAVSAIPAAGDVTLPPEGVCIFFGVVQGLSITWALTPRAR